MLIEPGPLIEVPDGEKPQIWAIAWECDDGSAGIYPFYFTPTETLKAPELHEAMMLFDLVEQETCGGWMERIDEPGREFVTY